jgi:hypothetical protein
MHSPHATLTETFLQHLSSEESLLLDALANVTAVHLALRQGDLPSAETFSTQQSDLGAALGEAAARRSTSARELAHELGLADKELTLSAIAAKLPEPQAAEVRAARERLVAVTNQLATIHTQNANLIGHLRSYFRSVLSGLAAPDAPQRYGRSGSRLESAAAGAIQTHG